MEPMKVFERLRALYPGVMFKMSHTPSRGWNLIATGPYGSLSMLTPDCPLRPATLEAACQLVSCDNLKRSER